MATLQAHVAAWLVKHRLKPALARSKQVEEARRLLVPPVYRVPHHIKVEKGEAGGVEGEWVSQASTGAVLLYVHGGGYLACSPETHRAITAEFAQAGFRVFAPAYRLAPEHPFPAALEDVAAAYRGLLYLAPGEVVISGESAGGGLALAALVSLRDHGVPLPAGAALFSPWTDLAATGDSIRTNDGRCAMFFGADVAAAAAHYLGTGDSRNPLASPLYADLTGIPPLLIHVGANEVLLDDSTRLALRARQAGVPVKLKIWPAVPHAWQLLAAYVPEARRSIGEAAGFLSAALEARRAAPLPPPANHDVRRPLQL